MYGASRRPSCATIIEVPRAAPVARSHEQEHVLASPLRELAAEALLAVLEQPLDVPAVVRQVDGIQVLREPKQLLFVALHGAPDFVPTHPKDHLSRASRPPAQRLDRWGRVGSDFSRTFRDKEPAPKTGPAARTRRTMKSWSFPRAEALPPYAFVITDAVKARVRASGADLIDLGLGNPDRPTPPADRRALHEAADVGKKSPLPPGARPARRCGSKRRAWYERRYGARFDPEQEIIITMGAKEGMSHLCLAMLDRGDVAIAPDPATRFTSALRASPAPTSSSTAPRRHLAGRRRGRSHRARRALRAARPKLVIANYPQNPTGQIVSKRGARGARARRPATRARCCCTISPTPIQDFTTRYAPSIFDCGIPADEVKEFAVEIFSMSKSYNMPGWRIAFMAGNARMVGALAHMKTYLDYGTFMPLQHAAAWALEHGDALRRRDSATSTKSARRRSSQGLRGAGWPDVAEPSGTMFVWAKVPEHPARRRARWTRRRSSSSART